MPLLLEAKSSRWSVEISGPTKELPPHVPAGSTEVVVEGEVAVDLNVYRGSSGQLEIATSGERLLPVFFENTTYHVYFEAEDPNAELRLPPMARQVRRRKQLAHYTLNFHNDVGFFDLTIEDEEAPASIRVEVFPSKIDYRDDYVRMRDEVAASVRNLVIWVQAKTYGLAAPSPQSRPTLVEWAALMEEYFADLMVAGRAVAKNPHSELEESSRDVRLARARRVDERELDRRLRGRAGRGGSWHPPTGRVLPARVPEVTRRVTYDTPVNRYVKAVLLETARKLKRIARATETGDDDADRSAEQKFFDAFRPRAKGMLRDLRGLLREPFLEEVARVAPEKPLTLALTRHPHYAALERAVQRINGGLEVGGGPLRVGVKDVALLYEYWCFLRLIDLLRERFDLEQQDVVRVKHLEFAVVLQKGVESTIRFRDRSSGRQFRLVYNRLFNALPTTSQRPDNVIQLSSDDALFVFDAKYRLAFDGAYQRRYGGQGPVAGDINTMHRYRDAIVIPSPGDPTRFRQIVVGAVVLFPLSDEEAYGEHTFCRSVDSVRIGGLPFLPGASRLVSRELERVVGTGGTGR